MKAVYENLVTRGLIRPVEEAGSLRGKLASG
jgi:hypothetical protein